MRYIKTIITSFITLSIIGYLFYFIDWELLLNNFYKINLATFILGISIFILYPIIVGIRWKTILNYHSYDTKISECLEAALHSFSLNLFAPAKSGDFIKILSMRSIENKSKLFSIIISERLGDIIVLSGMIVISNIYFLKIWELSFGLTILLIISLCVYISKHINFRFSYDKLRLIQDKIFDGLAAWRIMPIKMLNVACFSLLNWMIAALQVWIFFLAFDINISYLSVVSIFPITVLISIIPITPAGIGLRESAFLVFFTKYASPEICIIVGMLYFLSSTALNSFLGSFFIRTLFQNK
jgi:glycosyltransferase 2 family protein